MIGARQGPLTGLRRLVAGALARDIRGFVVPGTDVARAAGLDLGGTGLHLATTPRHASVLIVIGPLPAGLVDAATIAYAQMPRPRAILALDAGDLSPLPPADVIGNLTQAGLVTAIAQLRRVIATGAFQPDVQDYDVVALQTRIEYTCPMHPEIISDKPGNCPKCGMDLVPRKTSVSPHAGHVMPEKENKTAPSKPMAASHDHSKHTAAETNEAATKYTCPMHPEVVSDEPGSCPKCGMFLVTVAAKDEHAGHDHSKHNHAGHDHSKHTAAETNEAAEKYTCPMHPEVVSDEPGSCPKCGMFLVPVEAKDEHAGHDMGQSDSDAAHTGHGAHGGGEAHDGVEAHFMSMVSLTRDMPASSDGLKMEWIDVPFGPFFPGLPGGLHLDLTLDGDAVAATIAKSAVGFGNIVPEAAMSNEAFADSIAALSPLSPMAYRELACRALEQAAGQTITPDMAYARIAATERERIASHLGWLVGFGAQSGFSWLKTRATALQLKMRDATFAEISALSPKITRFLDRVQRTPLLTAKLNGIGKLTGDNTPTGPVARAAGIQQDARSEDANYAALGFAVLTQTGGDALARLTQRCGEIGQSFALIARAGAIMVPAPQGIGTATGTGEAVVETPRGAARLSLTLTKGKITAAEIGTPTAAHIALIATVAERQEIGDALTGIGSLDISPWEMTV